MRGQSEIPVTKVQRASRFVKTGAKIGGNYIKHYSKKLIDRDLPDELLDEQNASDIYNSLSKLKGSALKVAQMLSMDQNVLPGAYQDKFVMAQYSAPPLSYPLIVNTFKSQLGKAPHQIFDTFTQNAVNAASIGQVHRATKDGLDLAVKVQYPGVADSITSDLRLVKPVALRMFNFKKSDLEYYLTEVQEKLLEETDYLLELERSQAIAEQCAHLENICFARYYPELSSERIITMEWLEGAHLDEFLLTKPSQEIRNQIGQALWNFYDHQIHNLKMVHADPHPGNFLFRPDGTIGIIDFGCVKEIPLQFYEDYFKLINSTSLEKEELLQLFYNLNFLYPDDSEEDIAFYVKVYLEMTELLGKPLRAGEFDFSDDSYFQKIYEIGTRLSKMDEFRKSKHPRGARDGIYINRTYFGIFNMLNKLGAVVNTEPLALEA